MEIEGRGHEAPARIAQVARIDAKTKSGNDWALPHCGANGTKGPLQNVATWSHGSLIGMTGIGHASVELIAIGG